MKVAGGFSFPRMVKAPYRDGIGIPKAEADRWMADVGYIACLIGDPASDKSDAQGAGLMTLERTLDNAIGETEEAYQRFDKARNKFRSEIKNDVASVEASAKRIAGEFERVVRALNTLQQVYTSGAFVDAVANAERLAAALTQIQALSSSKLTFTVIENDKS